MCQDWLHFFRCQHAMGHERVKEGAMHVRVAFIWGDFAYEGRFVARHDAGCEPWPMEVVWWRDTRGTFFGRFTLSRVHVTLPTITQGCLNEEGARHAHRLPSDQRFTF